MPENLRKLTVARSIVERDALIARLGRYGIEGVTGARDMSRKLTENTIDLSLGGYSAVATGFAIFVNPADEVEAERILAQFKRETEGLTSAGTDDPWRRYYACAIFSLMMPGLMTVPATYHLVRAIRFGGRPRNLFYFGLATLCFAAGWAGVVLFATNLLRDYV